MKKSKYKYFVIYVLWYIPTMVFVIPWWICHVLCEMFEFIYDATHWDDVKWYIVRKFKP
jgi:hypothetical protein